MESKLDCNLTAEPRGEFFAMVLHELMNPLCAINLGVEALRGGNHDQSHPDWILTSIEASVGKVIRLSEDLLQLGHMTRPSFELQVESVDLVEAIRDSIIRRRRMFDEKRLCLHLQLSPAPIWTEGDIDRLELAIGNLLDNAIKYTPVNGRITVSAVVENSEAVVRVHDTGVGIAPEFLPFVFHPFARARNAIDSATKGSGIGLLLVRTLIELHNGKVEASSEGPEHGSTFVIRLPTLQATDSDSIEEGTQKLAPVNCEHRVPTQVV
jgi:signal transduction histidine kinase